MSFEIREPKEKNGDGTQPAFLNKCTAICRLSPSLRRDGDGDGDGDDDG